MVLVVARTEVWRKAKQTLIDVKRMAAHAKRRLILIPAGRIRRPTFISNCAIIGSSAATSVTATLRMTIVEQLIADPMSTIRDCATAITSHDDPIGAVFSMVSHGFLRVDLQKPLRPDSLVSLA